MWGWLVLLSPQRKEAAFIGGFVDPIRENQDSLLPPDGLFLNQKVHGNPGDMMQSILYNPAAHDLFDP